MSLIEEHKPRLILLNVVLLIPLIAVLSIQPTGPGYITAIDDIFSVSIDKVPEIDIEEWELMISGNIGHPVNFTMENLLELPQISQEVELQCVEGYFAYADWTGVALSEIMAIVNVSSDVIDVVFIAADGYDSSLNLDWIDPTEIILAYAVNNETLLPEIGYPLRVVASGQYGYKWVMWVTEIRFVSYDHIGYWESRGWMDNAQYERAERILFPLDWRVHALSLALAFYIGALTLVSGLREPLRKKYILSLPKWMGNRFHQILGISYSILTAGSAGIWIGRSLILKGALDWDVHGVYAVISLGGLGLLITERIIQLIYRQTKRKKVGKIIEAISTGMDSNHLKEDQAKVFLQSSSAISLNLKWIHILAGMMSLGAMILAGISGLLFF